MSSLFVTEGAVTPARQDSSGTVRARRYLLCLMSFYHAKESIQVHHSLPLVLPRYFKRSQKKKKEPPS